MGEDVIEHLPGLLAGILIAATVAAIPLSYLVSRRYSAAVARTMRQGERTSHEHQTTTTSPPPPLKTETVSTSDSGIADSSAELLASLHRQSRSLARAYVLAGISYALVAALILLPANDISYSTLRITAVSFIFLWPTIPIVVHVAVARRGLKFVGPILFLALALLIGVAIGDGLATGIFYFWAFIMVPPTLMQFAVSHRQIRNIGPFVTALLIVLLFGLYCTLNLILVIGVSANWFILLLFVAGMVVSVIVARWLIRWVAWAYRTKHISDQMLLNDVWWVIYSLWFCVSLTYTIGFWGIVLGLIPFMVARVTLIAALRGTRAAAIGHQPTTLLLLRVFGFKKRTQHLLQDLGHLWRYVGSIQLIAAPDVTQSALEPHELLDYASGRLSRAFIKDEHELSQRLSEIDKAPDPDGRFRVNELFCHENNWKPALKRLASSNDVVLMDLRGFSQKSSGCIFEIGQLIDTVPTSRFHLVTDESTNWSFLEQTLHLSWRRMASASPNRSPTEGLLRIYQVLDRSPDAIQTLIGSLCDSKPH